VIRDGLIYSTLYGLCSVIMALAIGNTIEAHQHHTSILKLQSKSPESMSLMESGVAPLDQNKLALLQSGKECRIRRFLISVA